ncbi:MAG: GWxTD domain-containing protein [Ignavibacteriales bacterium]|nr:GWxTD domain-containing protein [Ignavibacteriales bacterium]
MKKLFLLILLFLSFKSFGQKSFDFDFDYARFAYDSTSNFLELYYSFNQQNLTLSKTSTGLFLQAVLFIEIQDTISKKYLLRKNWKIENPLNDTTELHTNKSLIGVVGFAVPKGIYKCTLSGFDAQDSTKRKTLTELIKIEPFVDNKISISDIQLCSNIKQEGAESKSIFYKNTLEVYPNPTMVFGAGMPVLFYYSEIYNLKVDSLPKPLKLRTALYNSRGQKVSEKYKAIVLNANSRVEVGTLNLTKYPTDTYTLALSIIDSSSNYGISSTKRFFIYNPSVKDTVKVANINSDILSSQFNVFSDEECDQLFEKGKYLASPIELEQYAKLDSTKSKREFLYQYWKRRDQDPSTAENEFYNDYMNRVKVCEERYGTINKRGNKTDRGRVFILYGEPDEIDRYPNDIDKKPYEIWQYNQIEGGVMFVFGDVTGFSNYELLHSTKRGELRDDNWLRRIQTN